MQGIRTPKTKKPRHAAVFVERETLFGFANVRRLQALLALGRFKFDALVFHQRLESATLDLAEMRKQILAAVVRRDESKSLAFVEPLHGSGLCRHIDSFQIAAQPTAGAGRDAKKIIDGDFKPEAAVANAGRNWKRPTK
jgi:hypothetical protein